VQENNPLLRQQSAAPNRSRRRICRSSQWPIRQKTSS
jgi:hypothetical protein